MAPDDVDIARRIIEANRSGPPEDTVDVILSLAHPEVDSLTRLGAVEGSSYRGHDGVRRYFADLADAFREWRNDLAEIEAPGPGIVIADLAFRGVGHDSGMAVELESTVVFRLADGMARSIRAFPTRDEALAAIADGSA